MMSVRRYTKLGTLQRAQHKMGDEPRRRAADAARRVPRRLIEALSVHSSLMIGPWCVATHLCFFRPPSLP